MCVSASASLARPWAPVASERSNPMVAPADPTLETSGVLVLSEEMALRFARTEARREARRRTRKQLVRQVMQQLLSHLCVLLRIRCVEHAP